MPMLYINMYYQWRIQSGLGTGRNERQGLYSLGNGIQSGLGIGNARQGHQSRHMDMKDSIFR